MSGDLPKRYVFLLLPGYSLIGFSCALEALSLANRHPPRDNYYSWRILSEDGQPVPFDGDYVDEATYGAWAGTLTPPIPGIGVGLHRYGIPRGTAPTPLG